MSRIRCLPIMTLFALLVGGIFICQDLLAASTAPLGTYSGTLGATSVVGGSKRAGAEGRRFSRKTAAPQTTRTITVKIDSYSTQAELAELKAVQGNAQEFVNKLNTYNHGTMQLGGQSFPINSATSACTAAGKCGITLISAKPFLAPIKAGPLKDGGAKSGAGMGLIRLNLNSDGSGMGSMETTMQVMVSADGQVEGGGGATGRTELTGITHQ